MKNTVKRTLVLVLSALMCLGVLTGCGSSFSAGGLVQNNLDLIYLNQYTDEYLKSVDLTAEEADTQYEDGIEVEAEFFCDYFSIVDESCDETILPQIQELYRKIYAASKYEVGNVTENEDTYLVDLTIYPIDIFAKVMAEDAEAFSADWSERIASGEFDGLSDGDPALETAWAQAVIDMVSARLDAIGYEEPQTISVQVVPDEEGIYSIDANDFSRIDGLMISYNAN